MIDIVWLIGKLRNSGKFRSFINFVREVFHSKFACHIFSYHFYYILLTINFIMELWICILDYVLKLFHDFVCLFVKSLTMVGTTLSCGLGRSSAPTSSLKFSGLTRVRLGYLTFALSNSWSKSDKSRLVWIVWLILSWRSLQAWLKIEGEF